MSYAPPPIRARDLIAELQSRSGVWMMTSLLGLLAAFAYLVVRTNAWEASLALMTRDEVTSGMGKPGKFVRFEDMKTQQETVLELAKNRGVLRDVLVKVGPANGASAEGFPADRAVDDFADAVKVTPPKGAEFGKTEIFYVKVQDAGRERAIVLASQLLVQLQARFAEVRAKKAASVAEELVKTVALAEGQLDATTDRLSAIEQEVGRDLADLRSLNDAPAGETELRKTATELQTELRTFRAAISTNEELLHVLNAAIVDPGRLMASPMRLFEAQPALRRLKDGLVDAQLKTAQLLGALTPDHPQVIAAREAEQAIGAHLHTEIAIAVKGIDVDLRLARDRVAALEQQQTDVQARFDRLAALRADYGNLASKSKMQTETLKNALNELAEARASEAAAQTTSLLTPVDRPDTGSRPIGAGKSLILLSGLVGGLFCGMGWILLTVDACPTSSPADELAANDEDWQFGPTQPLTTATAIADPASVRSRRPSPAEESAATPSLSPTPGHSLATERRSEMPVAAPLIAPAMQPRRLAQTHTMRQALKTLATNAVQLPGPL